MTRRWVRGSREARCVSHQHELHSRSGKAADAEGRAFHPAGCPPIGLCSVKCLKSTGRVFNASGPYQARNNILQAEDTCYLSTNQ